MDQMKSEKAPAPTTAASTKLTTNKAKKNIYICEPKNEKKNTKKNCQTKKAKQEMLKVKSNDAP